MLRPSMPTSARPHAGVRRCLTLAVRQALTITGFAPRPALGQTQFGDGSASSRWPGGRGSCVGGSSARSGQVSAVSEFLLSMSTGETVTVETANISAGEDPVLHLLDFDGIELAVDDNAAGGTAAKVTYVADEPKTVIVMTRSKDQGTAGTTDLLKNGQPWKSGVTFAGWFGTYDGLVAGENLHTVQIPNGSTGSHRIYILEPDGLGLARRAPCGGAPSGATAIHLPSNLGQRTVIVGVPKVAGAGQALLLRNDVLTDADNDGLGDKLEVALGTCPRLSGTAQGGNGHAFDCALAAQPTATPTAMASATAWRFWVGSSPATCSLRPTRRSPATSARTLRRRVARTSASTRNICHCHAGARIHVTRTCSSRSTS